MGSSVKMSLQLLFQFFFELLNLKCFLLTDLYPAYLDEQIKLGVQNTHALLDLCNMLCSAFKCMETLTAPKKVLKYILE